MKFRLHPKLLASYPKRRYRSEKSRVITTSITVSWSEHQQIKAQATAAGFKSVSAYIRWRLLGVRS